MTRRRRSSCCSGWVLGLGLGLSACRTSPAVQALNTPRAPKYGALATPLSRSHDYFQRAAASDFWSLAPYYLPQQDDRSCSLASLTMLVNAARRHQPLASEEELVTQPLLLARVRSELWQRGLAPGGEGVTLDQLAVLATQSLKRFGLPAARVEVTHVPDTSAATLDRLRALLRQNEAGSDDWLLLNFDPEAYTGAGGYGHIAPVGAYDEARQRVLVLDPDRTWYEPYWVPDSAALAGMATRDVVAGQQRGYLYVSLCAAPCP